VSIATDPATGLTYTSYYDVFTVGAGYLDVWAALNSGDVASGTALSPVAVYNPTTHAVSAVFGSSVVWGTSVAWSTSVVWGTNVFLPGSSICWGSSVVWGTNTMQGFSGVWGNSVVWGTSQPATEAINRAIPGEN
jgi:serine protease AprX